MARLAFGMMIAWAVLAAYPRPAVAAGGLSGVDRAQFVSQMTRACVQAQGGGNSPLGLDGPVGGFCACVSDHLAARVTEAELSQIATTRAVPESVTGKANEATEACMSRAQSGD